MENLSIILACLALEILCVREIVTCINNAILRKKCTEKVLCEVVRKEKVKVYSRGSKTYRFANVYTYKNKYNQEIYVLDRQHYVRSDYVTGSMQEIYINPEKPAEFLDPNAHNQVFPIATIFINIIIIFVIINIF